MKILMLMGGGDVGGAKTHIMSLALRLSKEHEFKLVSFREGEFAQEALQNGIDVEIIASKNIIKDRKILQNLVKDFKPCVIHSHGAKANLLSVLVKHKFNIPTISTVHSDYKLDYLGSPHKQYTFGVLNAISLRKIDFYISVAGRMKKTLISRKFDPNNIFKIYNGIDFDVKPRNIDRVEYYKNFGFEILEDDVICGIGARLTEVKDLPTLFRAFKIAYDKNKNLKLAIAGDGEDKEELIKLAKDLGIYQNIMFLGWITDVASFFSSLDINLLTSISETFPYSVLEGILEGTATICSDVGGMSELIDTNINGYIFEPRDFETLSKYIYELSIDEQKREHFSDLLFKKAKEQFSLKSTYKTQVEIYENCVELYKLKKDRHHKITICGAYGKGNAGDDAILKAIVNSMQEVSKNTPICVMSRTPLQTKMDYEVDSVFTFNVFKFIKSFKNSKLYINGGGSLIQDVTSSRSLYFYLFTLVSAKMCRAKVMMYGCGIGPVDGKLNRKLAGYVVNNFVDVITLRDELSIEELKKLGVAKPEIILTADPTLNLTADSLEYVLNAFENAKIPLGKKYLGIGVRQWVGIDEMKIAQIIEYINKEYGLIPIFLPIEYPNDCIQAQKIAKNLNCEHYIIDTKQTTETTIGLFSKMDLVLGIRLHSLIFSVSNSVPTIGLSYDVKVDGFLKSIGSDLFINLKNIDLEKIKPMIKTSLSKEYFDKTAEKSENLRILEKENSKKAKELLK